MNIENFISDAVRRSVEALYGPLDGEQLQIQKTRREFEGDYTLVTFPLLRRSRKSPEATATEIGEYMTANVPEVKSFNVIKGFLNLTLDCAFWAARFAEIAARYAGQIHCMEVINETLLWYDEWKDQGRWSTQFFFEDDLVEWSFQCARKYFPQNELIINEATEQAWDVHAAGRSAYSAVISDSIRKGAVIDGIGLQYHLFYSKEREAEQACPLLSPKRLYGCMDHYWNRYHKPLQVTEVTIPAYSNSAEDEALQAEVLEKLFTIWFSHPAMEAAIYWNLVDGYAAFAPQGDMTAGENYYHGGLIHFDMTHKPAYDMMNELFHHRFRTEADGKTDGQGYAAFRGFEGDYELTVEKNGHSVKTPFSLRSDGGEVEIRLED